jgi:hypothetical protein
MFVWHSQAERQFVPDPRLQVDPVHRDVEEMLDDEVLAIMEDHEPATVGIGVLVGKLVLARWHVCCARLDDKRVDAHGERGEHGDECVVNLARCHWNV